MSIPSGFRHSTDVVFQNLGEEAVLLHIADEVYYGLNRTGMRIWQLLETCASAEEIVEQMATQFDCPLQTLRQDVDRIVGELYDNRLITVT